MSKYSKYINISLSTEELRVIQAILNDSGVSFDYMAKSHANAEHRAADETGIPERSCQRLAMEAYRHVSRALEDHEEEAA